MTSQEYADLLIAESKKPESEQGSGAEKGDTGF